MKYFIFLFMMMIASTGVWALDPNPQASEPLEITADGSLEWHRVQQFFIAKNNAKARQGDTQIRANELTANYRDGENNFEIHTLTATGNVVIEATETTAQGDAAEYKLDEGLAVLTGDNLTLTSPDQVVTARDRFEYWTVEGRLNAMGTARAIRGQDQLEADTLSAVFEENAEGERVLKTLEAKDNVVITTPTERVTGAYGIYNAASNIAEIRGNVTIKRGPNILEGERAEVNLTTNISRIFGAQNGTDSGRVRGVFFPGSENTDATE